MDLSVEGLAIASGAISPEEVNDNALCYYVGDQSLSFMTYGPIELNPQDSIILCSDGIHGNISDEDMAEVIKSTKEEINKGAITFR